MNKKITTYLERGKEKGQHLLALQGARRAGKTYTTCQWLLIQMLTKGDSVIFASMTAEQGRKGAYEDCKTILNSWGELRGYFEILKTPREIHCKTEIEKRCGVAYFSSYQDPESAKGGACDWVFINEANKFSKQQYLDLAANARKGIIVDFNPNVHFWIEDLLTPEQILCVSWKDNKKHLTDAQLQWFEQLYKDAHKPDATAADWYYYQVYYEGQYSELAGSIFTRANTQIIEPERVPDGLRNYMIFCDPSALCGGDFFASVLSADDGMGNTYVLDVSSKNTGTKEDICRLLREWATRYDDVQIYIETNGLVGIEFYQFAQESGLPVVPYGQKGGAKKFERIIAKYQEWTHNLYFVKCAMLETFLLQVYDFAEKCEHDDNVDAVCSSLTLHKILNL